ncbi:adenine-specific DNA-methyltransferase [Terribacillus aidingensis]|uniref:site-specific DNA-methyltransferase (adenine-specific) n=1 Tax=Terribacillus aidingensis TaxID=586416 RepID=A0A285N4A3_9BACI|nr:N-6 DNA methylase [Terribacillus aidingensis]SNZ04304.1 adenine-specific DNA-methyltransferase [Terribacillus aidingensis]
MEEHRLEESYLNTSSALHRRHYGQYFTPDAIADMMKKWVLHNLGGERLLDPAVGLGKLIKNIPSTYKIDAYEEDSVILDANRNFFTSQSAVELHERDFLSEGWDTKYDGILCNPPYIPFRNEDEREIYLNLFRQRMDITLSTYTNFYGLFLLKALHQLNENGRAAFIVPSDFLNARYGTKIKEYLLLDRSLSMIINTDIQMGWFKGAATTSSLLLFDKSRKTDTIEFIRSQSDSELEQAAAYITSSREKPIGIVRRLQDLNPASKWRLHFYQENQKRFTNVQPLNHFAAAKHGIKTGSNQYFCFNNSKVKQWQIGQQHFLPALSKSSQLKDFFFTYIDYKRLVRKDEQMLLLHVDDTQEQDHAVMQYLADGKAHRVDQRHTIRSRIPWYRFPVLDPAPILVSVFNRKSIQIVRNKTNVRHLDQLIGIYFYEEYEQDIDLFMAYFLSDRAQELMANPHKEYGKDLKKLEAKDVNTSLVLDVQALTEEQKQEILDIYGRLEYLIIHDGDNREKTHHLQMLNDVFNALIRPCEDENGVSYNITGEA